MNSGSTYACEVHRLVGEEVLLAVVDVEKAIHTEAVGASVHGADDVVAQASVQRALASERLGLCMRTNENVNLLVGASASNDLVEVHAHNLHVVAVDDLSGLHFDDVDGACALRLAFEVGGRGRLKPMCLEN